MCSDHQHHILILCCEPSGRTSDWRARQLIALDGNNDDDDKRMRKYIWYKNTCTVSVWCSKMEALCDYRNERNMFGEKECLNVLCVQSRTHVSTACGRNIGACNIFDIFFLPFIVCWSIYNK